MLEGSMGGGETPDIACGIMADSLSAIPPSYY